MSSIVVSGDTSGAITLAAPAVSGTNTLTMPALTGTLVTNKTAGTIVQVVQATYATVTSTTSTSYVSSPLAVTITPTSSTNKILIMGSVPFDCFNASPPQASLTLYRNSTNLASVGFALLSAPTNAQSCQAINYLDSPATTSATTYTIYFKASAGTARLCIDNYLGTLIAMEVVA